VNGKIYAIGGGLGGPGPSVSTVEEYDPVTDTWTEKADMPTAREGVSTSVVNGIIYAIGGTPAGNVVEAYDPATDTWTKKADMPISRVYLSTSAVNGKIYAIGGSGAPSTVDEYNPATDTWTKVPDMLTARMEFSTSAVNGYIYAIGGVTSFDNTPPFPAAVSGVEKYDALLAPRRPPQGVDSKGKLATLWGRLKAAN